jgi:hypothetical protein
MTRYSIIKRWGTLLLGLTILPNAIISLSLLVNATPLDSAYHSETLITPTPEEILTDMITPTPEIPAPATPTLEVPVLDMPINENSIFFNSETLDSIDITVNSYEELTIALQNEIDYATIYLGSDITATDDVSIVINDNKTNVIIDGQNHLFNQYESYDMPATIVLSNTNTKTTAITFRNIEINGTNPSGVTFVPPEFSDVLVSYENVTFNGLQLVTHYNGTVIFIDCIINFPLNTENITENLAIAKHIQIGGETNIFSKRASSIHSNTSIQVSLIQLTDNNSTFTIFENAIVEIDFEGIFISADTLAPSVEIQPGASFDIKNVRGFTPLGENLRNFHIANDANVFITQSSPQTYACLRIEETFEMSPGGNLFIVRPGLAGFSILFPLAGGKAIFNEPNRVYLLSYGNPSIGFHETGTLEITTKTINTWHTTIENLSTPTYVWNNSDNNFFTLHGSYANYVVQDLSTNLQPNAPNPIPLNTDTFQISTATLITLGNLPLTVKPLSPIHNYIVGTTDNMAKLVATYTDNNGVPQTTEPVDALDDGRFAIAINTDDMDLSQDVLVESTTASLTTRGQVTIKEYFDNQLYFESVPANISFTDIIMAPEATTISRDDTNFSFHVVDSRTNPAPWQIEARLSSPLTATVAGKEHTLPNALVFVNSNQEMITLTNASASIYTEGNTSENEFDIDWDIDEGILLNILPGTAYSNAAYQATIEWSLINAP